MVPLFLHLFVFKRKGYAHTVLSSKPMVFVGKISYSLYLHHWLALSFLSELLLRRPPWEVHLLAVPMMTALALASYYWIEAPMRRMGHRIADRLASSSPHATVAQLVQTATVTPAASERSE